MLVQRGGSVVTRDELRQQIWPASVYVDFDHGLNKAIARLREALEDDATAPRYIETVPRVGYRFIGTLQPAIVGAAGSAEAAPRAERAAPIWQAAAFAGAVVLLAATWYFLAADRPSGGLPPAPVEPPPPSLAVVPFVNLGPDPQDDYFADGLSEELVTRLAGIRGLRVVARTSSFQFKGKSESAASIGAALKVDHLLEGSVRRSGDSLRITAQLIDARSDKHLWSQSYDRATVDLIAVQEEIARSVASALRVTLLPSDEASLRRQAARDPDAYRMYVVARAHLLGRTKGSDPQLARKLLDAVIERDPGFAAAHAWLSRYYLRRVSSTLADVAENERLGVAAAERAYALDPDSSESLQARANFQFWRYRVRGDYEAHIAGEANLQRAIEIDPTNSLAYEDFGRAILWHEPQLAESLLERAIEIDALCTFPNVLVATLLGNRGRLEDARRRCAELVARNPDAGLCAMAIGTVETYYGNFARAIPMLASVEKGVGGPARIQLWSMYMSMDDRRGAAAWLTFGKEPFEAALSSAARLGADGRHDEALAVLERFRREYPDSGLLDLPAARFALRAGHPQKAISLIEGRLPDLARGIEPISARNVIPAIDLALARIAGGAEIEGRQILREVAGYLDGSTAPKLPMFEVQRARVHALSGEPDAAFAALARAFDRGLRATWALDLRPQSYLYVDSLEADPALASLRADPRLADWFSRIRTANAAQLAQLDSARSG
jgi:TolB-like protein/Tfp pilus assembly protein PilF